MKKFPILFLVQLVQIPVEKMMLINHLGQQLL